MSILLPVDSLISRFSYRQCNRLGTHIQNQGAVLSYTIFTFFPSVNRVNIYCDISDSFHSIFTIIRLNLVESLYGISMTPSSFPICKDSNVFIICDFGIAESIRGMHIEFFTMDIFLGLGVSI